MARLQDYNTVTPTNNDKLLIVQSQGQGLTTIGNFLGSTAKFSTIGPIAAGATYDFSNYADGSIIFIYRPQDAGQSDYTGVYVKSTNWARLLPIKAVANITVNGLIMTNGTTSAIRGTVISL